MHFGYHVMTYSSVACLNFYNYCLYCLDLKLKLSVQHGDGVAKLLIEFNPSQTST
jgi:hypothetical protein